MSREAALDFSDEEPAKVYTTPTTLGELTPWFKTLMFIMLVCIALYFLKDGLGDFRRSPVAVK
eukprot:SAG22_NODE_5518_length_1000_cov_2.890122_1_plen_63_part_00